MRVKIHNFLSKYYWQKEVAEFIINVQACFLLFANLEMENKVCQNAMQIM